MSDSDLEDVSRVTKHGGVLTSGSAANPSEDPSRGSCAFPSDSADITAPDHRILVAVEFRWSQVTCNCEMQMTTGDRGRLGPR